MVNETLALGTSEERTQLCDDADKDCLKLVKSHAVNVKCDKCTVCICLEAANFDWRNVNEHLLARQSALENLEGELKKSVETTRVPSTHHKDDELTENEESLGEKSREREILETEVARARYTYNEAVEGFNEVNSQSKIVRHQDQVFEEMQIEAVKEFDSSFETRIFTGTIKDNEENIKVFPDGNFKDDLIHRYLGIPGETAFI